MLIRISLVAGSMPGAMMPEGVGWGGMGQFFDFQEEEGQLGQ